MTKMTKIYKGRYVSESDMERCPKRMFVIVICHCLVVPPPKAAGFEKPRSKSRCFYVLLCNHALGGSCGVGFLKLLQCLKSECLPARRAGRFLGKRSAYCSLLHGSDSLANSGLKNASTTIKQPVRGKLCLLRSGCFRSDNVAATEFQVMPVEAVGCIVIKHIATRVFLRTMFIPSMPNCT